MNKFFPGMLADSVQHIDLQALKKMGIKGCILDIDNTLVPNHVKDADENAVQWIERLKKEGFQVCIVSNASETRVVRFNARLNVQAIHRAAKPSVRAFGKALTLMGLKPQETAMVGDQIFTDILGGNRIGLFTILVNPIDASTEFAFVRLKRYLEKVVLSAYKKKSRNTGAPEK